MEPCDVAVAGRALGVDLAECQGSEEELFAGELDLTGPGIELVEPAGIVVQRGHVVVARIAVGVDVAERVGPEGVVVVAGELPMAGPADEGVDAARNAIQVSDVVAAWRAFGADVAERQRPDEERERPFGVVGAELGVGGPGLEGILQVGVGLENGLVAITRRAVGVDVVEIDNLVGIAVAGERGGVGATKQRVFRRVVVMEAGQVADFAVAAAVDGDRFDVADFDVVALAYQFAWN
mgnify:CR=1 FL=1